jgi:CheY-like chemotaxis protein
MANLPPCFHPTITLVLDDNCLLLKSMRRGPGRTTPIMVASRPEEALEHINGPLAMRRPVRHPTPLDDPDRFRVLAVAMIDYDMPACNGLDFCRQIAGSTVKRLMMTGMPECSATTKALRDGTIHGYHTKADSGMKELMRRMAESWFADGAAAPAFAADPAVAAHVRERLISAKAAEFYCLSEPSGVLMVTGDARLSFLRIDEPEIGRGTSSPRQAPFPFIEPPQPVGRWTVGLTEAEPEQFGLKEPIMPFDDWLWKWRE